MRVSPNRYAATSLARSPATAAGSADFELPRIKCLGKELLHACVVNRETLTDWSWWSFSHGDVGREHLVTALVTAFVYVVTWDAPATDTIAIMATCNRHWT